eukprot:SAG31_NODE_1228_length_9228_cov_5.337386_5_plen_139_part_00
MVLIIHVQLYGSLVDSDDETLASMRIKKCANEQADGNHSSSPTFALPSSPVDTDVNTHDHETVNIDNDDETLASFLLVRVPDVHEWRKLKVERRRWLWDGVGRGCGWWVVGGGGQGAEQGGAAAAEKTRGGGGRRQKL